MRDLGRFLGYFIILQLQASVFRRPGNEFTRRKDMLYIDEFQVYSNPGFADMLTMGRSYRVASHLATQARQQIGMGSGKDGDAFVQLVSTNARNKIIYPGVSSADAKYYSEEFGEKNVITQSKSYSKGRFFSTLSEEKVSTSVKEDKETRFSITDIIYKPFGQITYCIVKNNSVQYAGVSQIEYIPQELNETLDKMVNEFNDEQKAKSEKLEELMKMVENPNVDLSSDAYLIKYKDSVDIKDIKDPLDSSRPLSVDSSKADSTPTTFKNFNDDTLVDTKKGNENTKIKEYKNQNVSNKSSIGGDVILEEISDDDDLL